MPQVQDTMQAVTRDGFAVVEQVIEPGLTDQLVEAIEAASPAQHGMRNLFEHIPLTRSLVTHPNIASLVQAVLGPEAFAVRAILFDKIMGSNWHVGWHQDQAIAIKEKLDAPGFGPTSIKHGVPHTPCTVSTMTAAGWSMPLDWSRST